MKKVIKILKHISKENELLCLGDDGNLYKFNYAVNRSIKHTITCNIIDEYGYIFVWKSKSKSPWLSDKLWRMQLASTKWTKLKPQGTFATELVVQKDVTPTDLVDYLL